MILYKIVNRELVKVRPLTMEEAASCSFNNQGEWLAQNGMGGGDYTIRLGDVREATKAEIAALGRPVVPVPSAATAIIEKLKGI